MLTGLTEQRALQSLTKGIKEATDSGRQKELLSSARLALRIFFSMNNPGLTEVCVSPFICAILMASWPAVQHLLLSHPWRDKGVLLPFTHARLHSLPPVSLVLCLTKALFDLSCLTECHCIECCLLP